MVIIIKCDYCGCILKSPWSYDGKNNFCNDGCYTLFKRYANCTLNEEVCICGSKKSEHPVLLGEDAFGKMRCDKFALCKEGEVKHENR